jgi:hypothetical protein
LEIIVAAKLSKLQINGARHFANRSFRAIAMGEPKGVVFSRKFRREGDISVNVDLVFL